MNVASNFKIEQDGRVIRNVDLIAMINLDGRPQKLARSIKQLAAFAIQPYRFAAVNGWELTNSQIQTAGVTYQAWMKPGLIGTVYRVVDGKEYFSHEPINEVGVTYFAHCMSRGAIGIALSHTKLLQNAYDNGCQTIWVMEDDVEVHSDPNELSHLIDELTRVDPAWDVLFTDPDTRGSNGAFVPCGAVIERPNFTHPPLQSYNMVLDVSPNLTLKPLRYGAYSAIYRRSGMKKILDFYSKHKIFGPYDADMFYAPGLRAYSPKKSIVASQTDALSDNGAPGYSGMDGVREIPEPYRKDIRSNKPAYTAVRTRDKIFNWLSSHRSKRGGA